MALFCLALAGWAGTATAGAAVHIDTAKLLSQTSPHYKCWNIDASRNRGFQWRNLSSPNLLQLAAGLPAGYLRFGGSGNDALWYGDGIGGCSCAAASPRHFNCLNATMVDGLLALARAVGLTLIDSSSVSAMHPLPMAFVNELPTKPNWLFLLQSLCPAPTPHACPGTGVHPHFGTHVPLAGSSAAYMMMS